MAKDATRSESREKGVRRAYLVRSYDEALLPDDSAGYYFTYEEAEDVKRELEERYPQYLFSIEELELPDNPKLRRRQRRR